MSDQPVAARELALQLLADRDHTRAELERKLLARGVEPEVVSGVLDELQSERLQSDERYAENLVENRLARGYGPLRVRQELRQRGIAEELALRLLQDEVRWLEALERVRAKRFGQAPVDSSKEMARQARFLQQRGFELDAIRRALRARD